MPYIKQSQRQELDSDINSLVGKIKSFNDDKEGVCNYVISRIVASSMKPDTGWRYIWLSRAHEVFKAAGSEFYRRLLAPYENQAAEKNGDLEEYKWEQ